MNAVPDQAALDAAALIRRHVEDKNALMNVMVRLMELAVKHGVSPTDPLMRAAEVAMGYVTERDKVLAERGGTVDV